MSIIDELRKYIESWRDTPHLLEDLDAGDVEAIFADIERFAVRIDAEHQKAIRELNNLADASVLLPLDADGVPIHIGDEMRADNETWYSKHRVVGIELRESGGWSIDLLQYGCSALRPECSHHYHEPTVEDVLREFGDWYAHTKGGCDEDGIIAEYAAKLRLADGKGQ